MRRYATSSVDRFEELYDRDIETLISGGTPANTDLLPLRVFIADLRSMADYPIDDDFLVFHAGESAVIAARNRHSTAPVLASPDRGRALWHGVRRKVTASAVSLTMLVSAAGMAWAADGAAPGDWNYGLDRALESIGIGDGGAAERAEEMRTLSPDQSSDTVRPGAPSRDEADDPTTGLDRATSVVSGTSPGNGRSQETRARVSGLLEYVDEAERVDGGTVSELAKDVAGRPEEKGLPGGKGASENTPAAEHRASGDTAAADGDASESKSGDNPGKGDAPGNVHKPSRP